LPKRLNPISPVVLSLLTSRFECPNKRLRLTLNVLLSFAQFEREIIGERIRDKIAAQRRKGKWTGGIPVLGYDVDRSTSTPKLLVNATEGSHVRQIFDLYLQLGSLLPVVDEDRQSIAVCDLYHPAADLVVRLAGRCWARDGDQEGDGK
jgi:hypothetical protein